jgi:hypothetical protein
LRWPAPLFLKRAVDVDLLKRAVDVDRGVYDAHQSKIFESGISIMSPGPEYLDA